MEPAERSDERASRPDEQPGSDWVPEGVTRRGFVAGALGVGLGLTMDALGGSAAWASSSSSAGTPKRGGTLTVAASGGGSTDTLNPFMVSNAPSIMGVTQVYDPAFRLLADGSVAPWLVQELEPNKTGTQWTMRLRSGVRFHDGRPLTSADLIASMQQWARPT